MGGVPAGGRKSGPPADDLARHFLALVVARAPADRGEWSEAMLAELDQVAGRRARWRFALSAARAALVPPGSGRLSGYLLAAFAVTAATVMHVLMPQTGLVAAVAVPGLSALCAWVALSGPVGPSEASAAGRVVQAVAVAALVACPMLAIRLIAAYPGQTLGDLPHIVPVATFVGTELTACLLLVLRRPALLGAGRHSGPAGLAAAAATGSLFLLQQPPGGQSDNPVVTTAVVATAIGAPLAAGIVTAVVHFVAAGRFGRSVRCAVCEVLWGALLTGPAATIAFLLTTSRNAVAAEAAEPVFIIEAHHQGAASVLAWVAQDDVGGALSVFTVLTLGSMLVFLVSYGVLRVTSKLRLAAAPSVAAASWVSGSP
ncbi:MAG TPA: hypothetical protein VMA72_17360 [Streptosporangiaceae bacterium]|nr:hypothetical protein [Streptosporangiaceae bacterium]